MIDDAKTGGRKDAKFMPAGPGSSATRMCMGCNLSRIMLGGRGMQARWRCAACVARRAAA